MQKEFWFAMRRDWAWRVCRHAHDALTTGKMQSCPVMVDLCLCFLEDTWNYTGNYQRFIKQAMLPLINRAYDTTLGALKLAFFSGLNVYKEKCMNWMKNMIMPRIWLPGFCVLEGPWTINLFLSNLIPSLQNKVVFAHLCGQEAYKSLLSYTSLGKCNWQLPWSLKMN